MIFYYVLNTLHYFFVIVLLASLAHVSDLCIQVTYFTY
jgi:hypothetical protein